MIMKRSAGKTRNTTMLVVGVFFVLLSVVSQVQSFIALPATSAATRLPRRFSSSTRCNRSMGIVTLWCSRDECAKDKRGSILSVVSRTQREINGDRIEMPSLPAPVSTTGTRSSTRDRVVPSSRKLVHGEIAQRSLVKALIWRVTAAAVTLVSSLLYSGSLATAMSIVGSDFVTKSGTMFLGERVWNKVTWGQENAGDSAKRSLAKAILWRIFAASNTLICGIFLAKDLGVASKIAGTDTIFKTALFYVNERIWASVKWGKKYDPEYFI